MYLIDQHPTGQLPQQRREGPDAEREAKFCNRPTLLGQPDSDERSETGLNGGSKEIQAVQPEPAAGYRFPVKDRRPKPVRNATA